MPRISEFYGIYIYMYFLDHNPPHFHAMYGSQEIKVSIASGEILEGTLPSRARHMVLEWLELHRDELMSDWYLAAQGLPLNKIDPLS